MERKGLLETEAYLEGLSSVSNKPLQPIKLCGCNAKTSRFQEEVALRAVVESHFNFNLILEAGFMRIVSRCPV
jgi:hypothetical protein